MKIMIAYLRKNSYYQIKKISNINQLSDKIIIHTIYVPTYQENNLLKFSPNSIKYSRKNRH